MQERGAWEKEKNKDKLDWIIGGYKKKGSKQESAWVR